MNAKTVVILLVVLVIGVGALLLTRPGSITTAPNEASTDLEPIVDKALLESGITRISFGGGLSTALTLQRIAGKWRIIEPHAFPANTRAIDELLSVIAGLSGEPTDTHYGVEPDKPGLTIGNDDRSITLYFGERLGAGKAGFAIDNGTTANWIVDDMLHDMFESTFKPGGKAAFYAKKIDPLLMPEFKRVEIRTGGPVSVLKQRKDRWWIDPGDKSERALTRQLGEYPGVENYFELLNGIQIVEHVEYLHASGLSRFGLDQPLISARFVPLDADPNDLDKSMTLRVGVPADPADQARFVAYGRSDDPLPAVFTVATPIAIAFGQDATAFRDPRLIATPPSLIGSISIEPRGGELVHLAFHPQNPRLMVDTVSTALSEKKCKTMLEQLSNARAIEYAPTELAKGVNSVSVTVHSRLDREPERLILYYDPADTSTVNIHRAGEDVAIRVEHAAVASLIDPKSLMPDWPGE